MLPLVFTIAVFQLNPKAQSAAADQSSPRYYEIQEEPKTGENFSYATVQCWLPPAGEKVNGILCVVLHPHGENGVRFEDPKPWLALASKNHCALLGISFVEVNSDDDPWSHASHGTGRALLAAIDELAIAAETSRLHSAPLVVAGICEAGQFAYEFAAFAPERAVAFLTMGGGKHDLNVVDKAAAIPGLLIAATDRGEEALGNMSALFKLGQKDLARWSFLTEPIATYDHGASSATAVRFLNAALADCAQPLNRAAQAKDHRQGNANIPNRANALYGAASNETSASEPLPLSFVSTPLPKWGTVSPGCVDIGKASKIEDAPATQAAIFDVTCDPASGADEVRVLADQTSVITAIQKTGPQSWRISCQIVPKEFPSGGLRLLVPIRLYRAGNLLRGGITGTIIGKICGDIYAEPSVIYVANSLDNSQGYTLALASRSLHPIEVLEIQSGFPEWAKIEITARHESSVEFKCKFNPPPKLAGKSFSGILTIFTRSPRREVINVLFCGTLNKDAN